MWAPARGLVAHYALDGDLRETVAVAPGRQQWPRSTDRNGEPGFAPGPIGQAATFDGKGFIQGGDIAGFEQPRLLRRQVLDGRVDYPAATTGAIVTKVQRRQSSRTVTA